MTSQELKKVLDFLKNHNLLNDDQYKSLSGQQFSTFVEAEKQIRRVILISDEEWVQAKGVFYDLEYKSLIGEKIGPEILNILPQDLSENYKMGVFNKEGNKIEAGFVDPTNFKAIEALNFLARKRKFKVKYYIISEDSYRAAVKQYESLGEEVGEALDTAEAIFGPDDLMIGASADESPEDIVKSAPVSKIISVVLRHAI